MPRGLKRRAEFLAVRNSEKRRGRLFLMEVLDRKDAGEPRFGLTVTKKCGNAVVRNRIRRRLREAVRGVGADMQPGNDYVIVARPDALGAPFGDIKAELAARLRRRR